MNKLVACLGLAMAASLSGCTLYFGEDHHGGNDCPPGTYESYDEWGNEVCVASGGGGYGCSTDDQCATGCYCDENVGVCAEAGYCAADSDCGAGMSCDCSGSCVPTGSETRSCGTSCWDTGCPAGTVCTADGTCQVEAPTCTDDTQCAAGCFCLNGFCEESSTCASDADCPADQHCDEPRSTCVPGAPPPPAPSCAGAITCTFGAPTCPAGQVPTILDGCWTGQCVALESCTAAPTCAVINTDAQCLGRADCHSVYVGLNCTNPSTGQSCTMGASGCVCESFAFDHCTAN